MVGLGSLGGATNNGVAGAQSSATAVSTDGSVVVGATSYGSGNSVQAFRWTAAGGMVGLGFLPGTGFNIDTAYGVSGDGSVVVGSGYSGNTSSQRQAFRWTASDGVVGLGWLQSNVGIFTGAVSEALAISFRWARHCRLFDIYQREHIPAGVPLDGRGRHGRIGRDKGHRHRL